MKYILILAPLALIACHTNPVPKAPMKKLTPILLLEEIEPSLPFWRDRLEFEVTVQVPEGDQLAFVILRHGSIEVMLQSLASVEKDDSRLAAALRSHASCLYLEVDDLAVIEGKLEGVEILMPRRSTFYGADEVTVRTPGGHVVVFAQMSGEQA